LKLIYKYILLLVPLNILLIATAFLLVSVFKLNILIGDTLILSLAFSIIALVTLVIFFKGQSKEPDSQTLYILVAVSLKLLLEMLFAILWFFVAKKSYMPSVLMFFVIYLSLTLYSLLIILKTLRNKVL
jgi:hypothetical protein